MITASWLADSSDCRECFVRTTSWLARGSNSFPFLEGALTPTAIWLAEGSYYAPILEGALAPTAL